MIPMPPSVPLHYTVAQSTPHSGKYGPEHILLDKPQDHTSRWSGAYQGNNAKQWVLLKLDQMSILKTITFGKFSKLHPCNMKDFKVYVGITEQNLVEVLHGALKNDTTSEAFPIRYVNNAQVCFPTRYVKIIPLSAHGQNFHTSIWHISMTGIAEKKYVEHIYRVHEEHRESTVLRHVLKHLRHRRLLTPYQDVLSRAFTTVEHPLITHLHSTLVLQGAFKDSEKHLRTLSSSGLFSAYLQSSHPYAAWSRITGTDRDGDMPTPRSGHAMCIDHVNGVVYIHGGYNSDKSLDDFWAYSTKEDKWEKLSDSTQNQAGPSPRSCHKMAFDVKTGSVYVLGRLTDVDAARASVSRTSPPRSATPVSLNSQRVDQHYSSLPPLPPHPTTEPPTRIRSHSELYMYHTRGLEKGTWKCISVDTAGDGGPPLVFDHQMVIDSENQVLYVHGGRVTDGDWDSYCAGLYACSLRTGRWKRLQPADNSPCIIPPRHGHSMVLDQSAGALFIFGGQREERYLADMYIFDLNTNTVSELFSNFTVAGGPDACFTQRAVIDTNLKEIYVYCGLITDSTGIGAYLPGELYNWVYRYNTRPGTWTRIQPEDDQSRRPNPTPKLGLKTVEAPCPRYAHEVVYNPRTKQTFLFGGNANMDELNEDDSMGEAAPDSIKKMNDFWKMEICRPGAEEIIRKATYRIRRQQFREMCEDATPTKALMFLQTQVSPVVNHDDQKETEDYRSLMTFLLAPQPPAPPLIPSLFPTSATTSNTPSPLSETGSTESITDGWTKMRSRAGTPDDGAWSHEVSDEDTDSFSRISFPKLSAELLRSIEDPLEKNQRNGTAMSADRYAQRTEVFESLLEFVSEWDKEPSGSLLDFVTRNDSREDDV